MSIDEASSKPDEEQKEKDSASSSTAAPKKSHIETHEENLKLAKQKQEELAAEKHRRTQGTKMQEDRRTFEEQEIIKTQAKLKAERQADKEAMKEIKRKLAEDKENRRLAREKEEAERRGEKVASPLDEKKKLLPEIKAGSSSTKVAGSDSATTRIQMRLPDGSRLQNVFNSNECLSAVRLYVELQKPELFTVDKQLELSLAYPRKMFSEDDLMKPLSQLNMVPSASLMCEIKKRPRPYEIRLKLKWPDRTTREVKFLSNQPLSDVLASFWIKIETDLPENLRMFVMKPVRITGYGLNAEMRRKYFEEDDMSQPLGYFRKTGRLVDNEVVQVDNGPLTEIENL